VRERRLSAGEILLWGGLGAAAGLIAGIAASEFLGDVNPQRLRRAASRLQAPSPRRPSPAAVARAVEDAVAGDERLRTFGLRARAHGRAAVELHGWVPDRATRAYAARVARGVPGVESVTNHLLVRGEDDRAASPHSDDSQAGHLSA
jgi:osmotically-inducible protein OsmY